MELYVLSELSVVDAERSCCTEAVIGRMQITKTIRNICDEISSWKEVACRYFFSLLCKFPLQLQYIAHGKCRKCSNVWVSEAKLCIIHCGHTDEFVTNYFQVADLRAFRISDLVFSLSLKHDVKYINFIGPLHRS